MENRVNILKIFVRISIHSESYVLWNSRWKCEMREHTTTIIPNIDLVKDSHLLMEERERFNLLRGVSVVERVSFPEHEYIFLSTSRILFSYKLFEVIYLFDVLIGNIIHARHFWTVRLNSFEKMKKKYERYSMVVIFK